MQAEILRYQVARLRPEWFPMMDSTRRLLQFLNGVQTTTGPPWARGARWNWDHVESGFIGFDGADQLPQTDVLSPDDLIRMWAFSEYFSFAHRAAGLAAARADRAA
eukprot:5258086-Alexandrium_andersonii.AAC.1